MTSRHSDLNKKYLINIHKKDWMVNTYVDTRNVNEFKEKLRSLYFKSICMQNDITYREFSLELVPKEMVDRDVRHIVYNDYTFDIVVSDLERATLSLLQTYNE